MIIAQDSPAKAKLRSVVDKIKNSQSYNLMTTKQLIYLQDTARQWLELHPTNEAGLERYNKLCKEIERRRSMN